MKNRNTDQFKLIESHLRDSIPLVSKNINESFFKKLGLFGKEMANLIQDHAHRINIASNLSLKRDAQRVRDELLTSHYAAELGVKKRYINAIMNLPKDDPNRISLEGKIRTMGHINPTIGALQKSGASSIARYNERIKSSREALKFHKDWKFGQIPPGRRREIRRMLRKNLGKKPDNGPDSGWSADNSQIN